MTHYQSLGEAMTQQERIRLARRVLGMSQSQLAQAVGVQRSAVSHWEAPMGKNPSVSHLREIALVTGIQFEWLATGRGEMPLSKEMELDSIATAEALLVEDPLEFRLVEAFRAAPLRTRLSLLEVMEELAAQRTGRTNGRRAPSARQAVPVTG
ncbi:MAG: XRE family transcriptional regulator [Proteobacteria bacterium]|nr:MAG: XRE family transcriptional regulator [Pseudomonadota bacterium]